MRVHPRVGGETVHSPTVRLTFPGPSPRGRGNLLCPAKIRRVLRSIPAWAGKPLPRRLASTSRRVHPRVGGETPVPPGADRLHQGPSPRGRGNQGWRRLRGSPIGSIPAWAGKPFPVDPLASDVEVHPRVGGETLNPLGDFLHHPGPSPRGRGNRLPRADDGDEIGSIPAWAGKPSPTLPATRSLRVHPRVGGETDLRGPLCRLRGGPSPRGRGNPRTQPFDSSGLGSIPAWAGKPACPIDRRRLIRVHPRVGGETMVGLLFVGLNMGPSPRGRGNRRLFRVNSDNSGSIPAWAGKPSRTSGILGVLKVHPRVGGETGLHGCHLRRRSGPSPRGRGNPRGKPSRSVACGSIPAWAGKPSARRA